MNDLATSELHAFDVYRNWLDICPGSPMIRFSGFATLQDTRNETSAAPSADILYDPPPYPMLQVRDKSEIVACVADVETWRDRVQRIREAVIVEADFAIDEIQCLAISSFGLFRDATVARVRGTSTPGASGSRTFLVTYLDRGSQLASRAFIKVGPRAKILSEHERYQRFLPGLIAIGTYAPYIKHFQFGLSHLAAIFYDIAEDFPSSLFRVAASADTPIASTVALVRVAMGPWRESRTRRATPIRELRRSRIADDLFQPRSELTNAELMFEDKTVEIDYCVQHGDFHGGNVLVSSAGRPLLIDFGDVGSEPRRC